jgi:hypothetical protein
MYSRGTPRRIPATPRATWVATGSTGSGEVVLSRGSCPAMAVKTWAASSTLRVKGPIWSREEAKAISP